MKHLREIFSALVVGSMLASACNPTRSTPTAEAVATPVPTTSPLPDTVTLPPIETPTKETPTAESHLSQIETSLFSLPQLPVSPTDKPKEFWLEPGLYVTNCWLDSSKSIGGILFMPKNNDFYIIKNQTLNSFSVEKLIENQQVLRFDPDKVTIDKIIELQSQDKYTHNFQIIDITQVDNPDDNTATIQVTTTNIPKP